MTPDHRHHKHHGERHQQKAPQNRPADSKHQTKLWPPLGLLDERFGMLREELLAAAGALGRDAQRSLVALRALDVCHALNMGDRRGETGGGVVSGVRDQVSGVRATGGGTSSRAQRGI